MKIYYYIQFGFFFKYNFNSLTKIETSNKFIYLKIVGLLRIGIYNKQVNNSKKAHNHIDRCDHFNDVFIVFDSLFTMY